MASTYTPIATTTLGSPAASYTFSSIPSTYTDLVVVVQAQISGGAGTAWIQLNSDTATNYSDTFLTGNGSSATSTRNSSVDRLYIGDAYSSGTGNFIMNFMNYSNTTTYKTSLYRSNVPASSLSAVAGLWRSTSAISSITIGHNAAGQNWIAGSTFTLYGIKAA